MVAATGCLSFGGPAVEFLPEENVPEKKLTAREISDLALEAERRRKNSTNDGVVYTFQRRVVIEETKGDKLKRKTRTYQSFSDHREPVVLLIDGEKPTPEQAAKEQREIHKHQTKFLGSGSNDAESNPEDPDHKGDPNLMVRNIEKYRDRFIPHLLGREPVNDRPAFVLQFLYDKNQPFKDELVNEVLSHMLIKVWIDQEDFQVSKAEVMLANPLFVLGGLAATVESFKLTAQQIRLTPEIWADLRVRTSIKGRVLWTPHVIEFTSESTGFKRLPEKD